jgi:sulfatase maturation enzyme AslB (radical SAM superfamily)
MIGISKLYCGTVEPSDALRYGRHSSTLPSHLLQFSKDKRPVVVWNVTRKCNLKCVHCYAQATEETTANELSTDEGKALIDDLAQFGAPVMLFSGGEPLVRKDLPELAAYAVEKGMRAVISTNGTLITAGLAKTLKSIGLSYVGISLDGMEGINDKFGVFPAPSDKALEGIRNCQDGGHQSGAALSPSTNSMWAKSRPSSTCWRRWTSPGSAFTTWFTPAGAQKWSKRT